MQPDFAIPTFRNGVGYSYIASEQAFIFLYIEKDDCTYNSTLSRHSAETTHEPGFSWWKTAIAQVV